MQVAAKLTREPQTSRHSLLKSNSLGICLAATWLIGMLLRAGDATAQSCPPLGNYYPSKNPASVEEWRSLLPRLQGLLESCLRSSEYFALLGAAQLNSGEVAPALESLERALLLDPENGAAQIDYAETLYRTGQLFAAIEINKRLLQRDDLLDTLKPALWARDKFWAQQTANHQFMMEATGGYDTNLNGAPSRRELTLTIGDLPVTLALTDSFQRQGGAYTNLRVGGSWQWLASSNEQGLQAVVRVREAPAAKNDIVQGDWRYSLILPNRHFQWEMSAGTSHMLFGGNPLYSIGDLATHISWKRPGPCVPGIGAEIQRLHYHGQQILDGVETSLNGTLICNISQTNQRVGFEMGGVQNKSISDSRPGADRSGWDMRISWQASVGVGGEITTVLGYSKLSDNKGYSPLLANNRTREINNKYINLRYRKQLDKSMEIILNLNHQFQGSNLQPFQNRGTALEVGLSAKF